jgi:hypothetical protein
MMLLSKQVSFSAVIWALAHRSVSGFTTPTNVGGVATSMQRLAFLPSSTELRMAEEKTEKTATVKTATVKIPSVKKELSYDEATGRFYESNPDECAPEDGEYCAVDKSTGDTIRLTIEEKERIFLDALQSYYATGRQVLGDEEFDLLKEDLTWNGSEMVVMNRKEVRFLGAVQAYLKGDPLITDVEFDTLKSELKEEKSIFAVSREPKCYIDTGICTVTLKEDKFRSNLLYLPVGLALTSVWLGFGYEVIEPIIRLNPLILLILGAYPIATGTLKLTDSVIFQNAKIAYGPCPSCEAENRVYFGNILFVEGFSDVASVKCTNCKTQFQVQRNTLRASTVPKAE